MLQVQAGEAHERLKSVHRLERRDEVTAHLTEPPCTTAVTVTQRDTGV